MGNRLYKVRPKLSEDAKVFAVSKLACNVSGVQVAKEIKEKFDIDISDVRVRNLVKTKRFGELYEVVRVKYLNGLADLSDIALYSKRTRLEQIGKMNTRLSKIVDKLADRVDLGVPANTFDVSLVRELRGLVETSLKALKQAQVEVDGLNEKTKGRGTKAVSLINLVDKQTVNYGVTNGQKKVIDIPDADVKKGE